jgi:hypothetical protein
MGAMAGPPEPRALPALELAPDIPVRSIMLRRAFPDHPLPPPAEERFPGQEDLPDGSFGEERRLPAVATSNCDKDIDLSGSLDGVVAIAAQDNGTCTNADIDTYVSGESTYVVQAGGQEIAWTHTDVSDPANPVIVGQFFWDGSAGVNTYTPDVKAFQQGGNDYIALSLERRSTINAFCGVVIVNITDPAIPVIESRTSGSDWCDVHNTFVETDANGDGEYIYLTADAPNDMRVLDIGGAPGGSVADPVEIGRYIAPGANNSNYVHDITVLDHGGSAGRRVYLSYWNSGLIILDAADVTPGTNPAPIVGPNAIDPTGFLTHHAWASQDGSLVFIQDEFLDGDGDEPVQMWDVSDPANPIHVDGLVLGTDLPVNPAHNLEIRYDIAPPDRLYAGWYRLGLQAWDFTSDGFTRNFPGPHTAELYHQVQTEAGDQLSSGAWGVRMEEFGADEVYIFQSDRNYGLIISCLGAACLQPATGTIDGTVTDYSTGEPIVNASVSADSGESDSTDIDGVYALTSVPTGARTVTVTATVYEGQSAPASVTDGLTTTVDFALVSTTEITDEWPSVSITEPSDGATVGGKRVKLRANASDDGVVVQVEFFLTGGSLVDEPIGYDDDNSDGIFIRWDSKAVADGLYVLTAEATDNATVPQSKLSNPISITVDNGGGGGGGGGGDSGGGPNCPPNSNKPACR